MLNFAIFAATTTRPPVHKGHDQQGQNGNDKQKAIAYHRRIAITDFPKLVERKWDNECDAGI